MFVACRCHICRWKECHRRQYLILKPEKKQNEKCFTHRHQSPGAGATPRCCLVGEETQYPLRTRTRRWSRVKMKYTMMSKFLFVSGDAKCKILVKMNPNFPSQPCILSFPFAQPSSNNISHFCKIVYRIARHCCSLISLHKICAKNGNCDRRKDVECECIRARARARAQQC